MYGKHKTAWNCVQPAIMCVTHQGGETPLQNAVDRGHLEITKLLVGKGASMDSPDQVSYSVIGCGRLSDNRQQNAWISVL